MARDNSGKNIPCAWKRFSPFPKGCSAAGGGDGGWRSGSPWGARAPRGVRRAAAIPIWGSAVLWGPRCHRTHPLRRVPAFSASSLGSGGRECGGDPGRSLGTPRGGDTGVNPVTCPAAGPGREGSFCGQKRAAAPPPPGWRWERSFLTPLHPINHATVSRGLRGARANPQSRDVLLILYFMPLTPGIISPVQPAPVRGAYPAALPDPVPRPRRPAPRGRASCSCRSKGALGSRLAQRERGAPAARGLAVRGVPGVCR